MVEKEGELVSGCCRAKIKAHVPSASFYSLSPKDPVPYCTDCGAENPEEVEAEEKNA